MNIRDNLHGKKRKIFVWAAAIMLNFSIDVYGQSYSEQNFRNESSSRNSIYYQNYYGSGYADFMKSVFAVCSSALPELLIDHHGGETRGALLFEVPIGVKMSEVSHFIVPSFIYYPGSHKMGCMFMYYHELFPRMEIESSGFMIHAGAGCLKDSYGSGPKFDLRISYGSKDKRTLAGIFSDVSYCRDVSNNCSRGQLSMGFEILF